MALGFLPYFRRLPLHQDYKEKIPFVVSGTVVFSLEHFGVLTLFLLLVIFNIVRV
jgi:hypothetical protein